SVFGSNPVTTSALEPALAGVGGGKPSSCACARSRPASASVSSASVRPASRRDVALMGLSGPTVPTRAKTNGGPRRPGVRQGVGFVSTGERCTLEQGAGTDRRVLRAASARNGGSAGKPRGSALSCGDIPIRERTREPNPETAPAHSPATYVRQASRKAELTGLTRSPPGPPRRRPRRGTRAAPDSTAAGD